MSDLEEKLDTLLSNPHMMQQIMSLAQTLGQGDGGKVDQQEPTIPQIDPGMIQMLSGLAQKGGVDPDQQTLLHALSPYLSHGRVEKLERAMRAARMASMASAFLNTGGLQNLIGR